MSIRETIAEWDKKRLKMAMKHATHRDKEGNVRRYVLEVADFDDCQECQK